MSEGAGKERSFSLQFSPIGNVRSVKEYEDEIQLLKNEVFELKTQIAHGSASIPKILHDNNNKVEILSRENSHLKEQLINMKTTMSNLDVENRNLSNKLAEVGNKENEEIGLLKIENRKLLGRIERISNNAVEITQLRSTLSEEKGQAEKLKAIIHDLEHKIEILENERLQYDKAIGEYQNKIHEMENYGKSKFIVHRKNNSGEASYSVLMNEIEDLRMKLHNLENIEAEQDQILEQEKNIIVNKINSLFNKWFACLKSKVGQLSKSFDILTEKYKLVPENIKYLIEIGVKLSQKKKVECYNINEIVKEIKNLLGLKEKEIIKLNKKLEKLKVGEKSKIIEDLRARVSDGLKELDECRKYMQKKAQENKNYKNEILKLKNQQSKNLKQIENAKKFYENVKSKFGTKALKI